MSPMGAVNGAMIKQMVKSISATKMEEYMLIVPLAIICKNTVFWVKN